VWDYCATSAAHIFGDATGDPVADRILAAVRSGGAMTQTQISDLFARNVGAVRLLQALETLVTLGKIAGTEQKQVDDNGNPKAGRPTTIWTPR
jgi:hypothetical protein